jgi:putative colanic acid biosysnthesis UDP-glucose lipid carrier transferase
MDGIDGFMKRAVDLSLATVALLAAALPMLMIALAVKLTSPGPVFFRQRRYGLDGREIRVWKFRSMRTCDDGQTIKQATQGDPRITPVGALLRKTSLDELPQLWNIFKGDMSLVGPRPCMRSQIELYRQMYPLYTRVRPGLTGLWQVSGRNETSYEQRVRLDSYYVCNWSVWLDLYIIIRTFRTLLMREGAY